MPRNRVNVPSSFRDPSGFLFFRNGVLYRQVNRGYREEYETLVASGLLQSLVEAGLLVPHEEVDFDTVDVHGQDAYRILKPELIPFVSYPYEWSFSQLRDAALLTLNIQRRALKAGMSLKDCSAYNVQFRAGKPVFIDTLSFERYQEGQPWVAYRQFCQHFLAPLALMSCNDIRLGQLFRIYIDGVPLDLASQLLPGRTRLRFHTLTHIHLHARSQRHFADRRVASSHRVSRRALMGLLDSLGSAVEGLSWKPEGTEWHDYYARTNYADDAFQHKRQIVADFLDRIHPQPRSLWDLGANVGLYSRISSGRGIQTVAFDIDPACVESNYLKCQQERETHLLPLVLDLTNPSPGLGWLNEERLSLLERGPADVVLALALIHHLAIANNVPFEQIADFLARICRVLIIEFVPKHDSQVQKLLANRKDIFTGYTQEAFEGAFSHCFSLCEAARIKQSDRVLYRMERTGD